ncbi:MAG: hypothetical protein ACP5UN_02865 [Candidatus Micrarchaeia archaeon]
MIFFYEYIFINYILYLGDIIGEKIKNIEEKTQRPQIEINDIYKNPIEFAKKIKAYALKENYQHINKLRTYEINYRVNEYALKYPPIDIEYDKNYYTVYGSIIVSSFVEVVKDLNKYLSSNTISITKTENAIEQFMTELFLNNLDNIDIEKDLYDDTFGKEDRVLDNKKTIYNRLKEECDNKEIINIIMEVNNKFRKELNELNNEDRSVTDHHDKNVSTNINNKQQPKTEKEPETFKEIMDKYNSIKHKISTK